MNAVSSRTNFNQLFPATTSLLAWRTAYKARKAATEGTSLAEGLPPAAENGQPGEADCGTMASQQAGRIACQHDNKQV